MFRSEALGKYGRVSSINGITRLIFDLDGPTSRWIAVETLIAKNGDIRFQSKGYPKVWHCRNWDNAPNWVSVDYPSYHDPTDPNSTLFQAHLSNPSQGVSGVALLIRAYDRFCNPNNERFLQHAVHSENDRLACFRIINLGIPDKCQVTVRRQGFRHAWVRYTNATQEVVDVCVFENPSNEEKTFHTNTTSLVKYSFSNSVTVEKGTAHFSSPVPVLSEQGNVTIPDEVVSFGSRAWGQTYDYAPTALQTDDSKIDDTVTVPAMSVVKATLFTRTAICEIPFSYQVYDEFYGGGTDTQNLDGGVFRGEYTFATLVRIDSTQPFTATSAQESEAT